MMQFTPGQQAAIDHRGGHLQVIACAGSGKTQVLVHRIVGLLSEGVPPSGIIAFTFTEKAAAELKERVRGAVADAGLDLNGLVEMYIGTIHGWCLDFLQTSLNRYLKFRVMNEPQTKLFISRYSKQSGMSGVTTLDGKSLKGGTHDVRMFHAILNLLREDKVELTKVQDCILEGLDEYRALMHKHGVLDYSELLHLVEEGFAGSEADWKQALSGLHARLKHLLVDEYQDVNPIQERLIRTMTEGGAHLTVVGDDDQTIYAWRGSAVHNILTFADRYPDVTTVQVTTNFRSTPAIVETGRRIAELNDERLIKAFEVGSHHRHEDGDMMALSFSSQQEEAAFIAQRIEDYHGHPYQDRQGGPERGLAWSDMAVLLRSVRKDGAAIIEELRERGIPFIVRGVQALFDRPEIIACQVLFEYLAKMQNPMAVMAAWRDTELGLDEATIGAAIQKLPTITDDGESWGFYNIQRVYLQFLEDLGLVEEGIPDPHENDRGALIYYNLGMFSQVISDFEQIHFRSAPVSKYETFAKWLHYEAKDLYDEGGLEGSNHMPNAVSIMTVHQAKGLQWPAVFVPCMQRNRFPAQKVGGRKVWHFIPQDAVENHERYVNSVQDERRLFYVAVTRAERFLMVSYSPGETRNTKHESQFMQEYVYGGHALTAEPMRDWLEPLEPQPRVEQPVVSLSFSEWKYWSQCGYLFKLRFLYGFNPPIHEALGYGKSLHDALAEAHRRAIAGDVPTAEDIDGLLETHLHLPFAYPTLRETLEHAAHAALGRYLTRHGHNLVNATHSEQAIEFSPSPGLIVHGRIDLITENDTNTVRLIDFKSTERAQAEDVSQDQLLIYAAGFRELDGRLPDFIEVINLDERGKAERERVEEANVATTVRRLEVAGQAIREDRFDREQASSNACATCDLKGICRQ